ncbi:MAG: hypothetical protein GY795_11390 [Desulfobacterales bacterium]|nr:hypothetical protein [Desulfobacterales bacterium]
MTAPLTVRVDQLEVGDVIVDEGGPHEIVDYASAGSWTIFDFSDGELDVLYNGRAVVVADGPSTG